MNMNLILPCDFACFLCYEIQKGDKLKENLTKSCRCADFSFYLSLICV